MKDWEEGLGTRLYIAGLQCYYYNYLWVGGWRLITMATKRERVWILLAAAVIIKKI